MRDNRRNQKKKGLTMVALACFLCLSAIMVGVTVLNKKDNKAKDETQDIIDLNDTKKVVENETTTINNIAVDGKVTKEEETTSLNPKDIVETGDNEQEDQDDKVSEESNQINAEMDNEDAAVSAGVANMSFNESTKLMWPIEGNIILDYNMENTIYFPTLDSYKCNPAIVIQGEKGMEVMAGVTGVVETIDSDDEIGQYVTLNLGNEYKLTFGQLENINVEEGQTVNSDTCIGVVAEPTKYYTKEGSNLYYMLTKNNEPCDPLDYLS